MKSVLCTPIFDYPYHYFTGDNVAHLLPAKLLWWKTNECKETYSEPLFGTSIEGPLEIDLAFSETQPIHRYIEKPAWIRRLLSYEDPRGATRLARGYDAFVNSYRYRGKRPNETNVGWEPGIPEVNVSVPASHHELCVQNGTFIDDLSLTEELRAFLAECAKRMNPDGRPVLCLHQRGQDPWNRHLAGTADLNVQLVKRLRARYPDHHVVLLGESWADLRSEHVSHLDDHVCGRTIFARLGRFDRALQFLLQAFFAREAHHLFIGISGFSLFLETIRSAGASPPVPLFWGPETFSGYCTFLKHYSGFDGSVLERYKSAHPEDPRYHHQVHHFLYHGRRPELLEPFVAGPPDDLDRVFALLDVLDPLYPPAAPAPARALPPVDALTLGYRSVAWAFKSVELGMIRLTGQTLAYLGAKKRMLRRHFQRS